MNYDFETLINRHGHDAMAVDVPASGKGDHYLAHIRLDPGFDAIPMWIADMNFATVPAVTRALAERIAHPLYGYFQEPPAYYEAILRWQQTRHGVTGLTPDCIGYENGVLGGIASALRAVCAPGEPVLLHSPTYVGFTHTLADNGWEAVLSPLRRDESGIWRMDFVDMENKLRTRHIHAAVFCSPHNPAGRVWERWELERMMDLFARYDVTVISDEIWSDLVLPGHTHIPTQAVSADARRRTVAFYAPSKTFNLAGLVGSYHIIYDPALRDRVRRAGGQTHYNSQNVLSMHALMAAYSEEGAQWLDQLLGVLDRNQAYAVGFIQEHFDGVRVARPQGTYMLFPDCSGWCAAHGCTLEELVAAGHRVGVIWQNGAAFHGEGCIRMNLALPHRRVRQAFERLDRYVFHGSRPQ